MTNLDPKHLDALDGELREIGLAVVADTITDLRAQIDRERAATIEAAVKACEACAPDPAGEAASHTNSMRVIAFDCRDKVAKLHTDATRAAMDAIRREGYEAGVRDARQLCAMLDHPTEPWNEHDAMIFHIGFTAGRKGCEKAIAAKIPPVPIAVSIPPDPDTTPRE